MKIIVLLISAAYFSLLSAQSATPTHGDDMVGIILRTGLVLTDGAAKLRKIDHAPTPATHSTDSIAYIGNGVDVTVGYEKPHYNVRFLINVKISYESLGVYELQSTSTGVGIEGYSAFKDINFNYGCLLVSGSSDFTTLSDKSFAITEEFLGAEPYVGVDGLIVGGFGYYARLAYEVKGYDEVNHKTTSTDVSNAYVVYSVNVGLGLSYKF